MKAAVVTMIVLLVVAHQDYWLWTDATQVFGFMPIGLAWHIGVSLAAAAVWFAITRLAWPADLSAADLQDKEPT